MEQSQVEEVQRPCSSQKVELHCLEVQKEHCHLVVAVGRRWMH